MTVAVSFSKAFLLSKTENKKLKWRNFTEQKSDLQLYIVTKL